MPTTTSAISDSRRIRVYRVVTIGGEASLEAAADLWQDHDGTVNASGIWSDSLIPSVEDLMIQARQMVVSPLEFLRLRLQRCPIIRVEVVG